VSDGVAEGVGERDAVALGVAELLGVAVGDVVPDGDAAAT